MTSPQRGCLRAAIFFLAAAFFGADSSLAQTPPTVPPVTPTFDILEFQIEGNTVLPVVTIERAVTPFLGYTRDMAQVEAARGALEKAYQGAGFLTVFVDVPEQKVDDGIVVLKVVEGRIERLQVSGARYYSQGYIRDRVTELAEGTVPNFNEVQRQLALVNRGEERRVQPVMRAGLAPGTVEAELKVDDKLPLSGTIEFNNRQAAETKPLRLSATARYGNLFQLDHSVSFTAITAPQATEQSQVFSLNYTIPLESGASLTFYGVHSNSSVATLGDVTVLGKGDTFGLRWATPVAGPAGETHSVTLGVDYKDLKEDTKSGADTIATPLRYLPFVALWTGSFDHGALRQTTASLQLNAAFRRILQRDVDCPGGRADQFACKRNQGDGGFAALRADVRHTLPLGDTGALARLRLGGQFATGPVPSGEQYTIGGAETVRGYYEAEGAGDHALLGSLELRSSDLGIRVRNWLGDGGDAPTLNQLYALAFVDVARAYTSDPAAGQAKRISLAGGGVGLRVTLRKSLTGEFDLAWPFKAGSTTEAGSPRIHVRIALEL